MWLNNTSHTATYRIRSIHVSLQNQNHSSQRLTNKTAFKIQLRKAPWLILHRLKMIFPRWHAVSFHTEKLWVTLKWRSLLLKLPLTWYVLCLLTQSCHSSESWWVYDQVVVRFSVWCVCVCVCAQSLQLCLILCKPMDCSPPGSSVHGDSSGKNTGVGCHALLQGIFPTQRLNPGLLHFRRILYQLSYQGSP